MRPSDNRAPLLLALASLALASAARPVAAQQGDSVVVHLRDGSTLPLLSASLSYEYVSWRQGTSSFLSSPDRKPAPELWLAKKSYPLKGHTLEIEYAPRQVEREVEGTVKKLDVQAAIGLALLAADGKRTSLKLEPPHRDLLLPDAEKGMLLSVRTLDLVGETLTGTHRELCLVSFTSLVECPYDPSRQVAKIEFQ